MARRASDAGSSAKAGGDAALFARLGIRPMEVNVDADDHDHPGTVHLDIAPRCAVPA